MIACFPFRPLPAHGPMQTRASLRGGVTQIALDFTACDRHPLALRAAVIRHPQAGIGKGYADGEELLAQPWFGAIYPTLILARSQEMASSSPDSIAHRGFDACGSAVDGASLRHNLFPTYCLPCFLFRQLTTEGELKRLPFIHAYQLGNFCGFEAKNHRADYIF